MHTVSNNLPNLISLLGPITRIVFSIFLSIYVCMCVWSFSRNLEWQNKTQDTYGFEQ